MSSRIVKTIRTVEAKESQPKPVVYWRTRPVEERLAETLALHREGNALFKGGNPPFVFELKVRYVADLENLEDAYRCDKTRDGDAAN